MALTYIRDLAEELIDRYGTRNPFKLCKELDIDVVYDDIGSLKGLYTIIMDCKFILINANLNKYMKKIVCAHELGHEFLHHEFAQDKIIKEFMIYDMKSRPEYEANIFACHILLDDKEVYNYAKDGCDAQQIANLLNSDVNLVSLKLNEMICDGYNLRNVNISRSNFMK